MPIFSVLITAYNYGRYIDAAIQSVLGQSFAQDQFEIIVIDDGSTDDTAERVARFGDAVRYYYQENSGQAAAFNAGIANSNGSYIAFLDADDVWHGSKLERVKALLDTHPSIDLIYHELIQIDAFGDSLGELPKRQDEIVHCPLSAFREGRLRAGSPTSGIICSRQVLDQLYPVPLEYTICADSYIMVAAPFFVDSICFMSDALAYYRLHDSNGYNTYDKDSRGHICRDDLLLWSRLKLDLQAIKALSLRLDIDLSLFCAEASYKLMVVESMHIRGHFGIAKALLFFVRSYKCWNAMPVLTRNYKFISTLFRLAFGNEVFNAVACNFVGSRFHGFIRTLIAYDTNKEQSAHE